MNCKKCAKTYANSEEKCPHCGYSESVDKSLLWIDDENTSDTFSDKEVNFDDGNFPFLEDGSNKANAEDFEMHEDSEIEIEEVYEDSEIEIEEVYEDSEVEIKEVYEVQEIAPDVYEDSEVEEFSKEDLLRDSSVGAVSDNYKVTLVNDMPDDYEEELSDDIYSESVVFEESNDGSDSNSAVFEESDSVFAESSAVFQTSDSLLTSSSVVDIEVSDDSVVFDEISAGEIYEDSVLDIKENSVVAGLKSDVYKKDKVNENEDLYEDVEWSIDGDDDDVKEKNIADKSMDIWLKCPKCHKEEVANLKIDSSSRKIKCSQCEITYSFFISKIQKIIVRKLENVFQHFAHLQSYAGEKKELEFLFEKDISKIEEQPAIFILSSKKKDEENSISIIGCMRREFYVVDNTKFKSDIQRIIGIGLITLILLISFSMSKGNNDITRKDSLSKKITKISNKKPITLQFKEEIRTKKGAILVQGISNLPDDTMLRIELRKEYGKKLNFTEIKIKNGKFETKALFDQSQKDKVKKMRGKVIVKILCYLHRSGEKKSILDLYEGQNIKKEKTKRGLIKKLEIKRKIKLDNYNEKKEANLYKLQQWTRKDIEKSKKWNSNYYENKLGRSIQNNPKKGDSSMIQNFYFPKANVTIIANLYDGKILKWGIGKR